MRSLNDSMVGYSKQLAVWVHAGFQWGRYLVICLWKERRRILSRLLPSLSETCFVEAPLCFPSPSVSPSAAPPLVAAPAGQSPASCPPETAEGQSAPSLLLEACPWTFLFLLTCQASSSWESATLCLMVLRSCWVSSSFSWRTVASSLSKKLNVTGKNVGWSWQVEVSSSQMIKWLLRRHL